MMIDTMMFQFVNISVKDDYEDEDKVKVDVEEEEKGT